MIKSFLENCISLFEYYVTPGISIITVLVSSDAGFRINEYIRSSLRRFDDLYINLSIQAMFIGVSIYLLLFSSMRLYPENVWLLASGVVVLLSTIQSSKQRGSVVSASLSVTTITCVGLQLTRIEPVIILAALYNHFFLHKKSKCISGPDLPLLESEESDVQDNRFRYLINVFLLLSIPYLDRLDSIMFINIGFIVCIWILVAPFILSDRQF